MRHALYGMSLLAALSLAACNDDDKTEKTPASIELVKLATLKTGGFNEDGGGAEIPAFDPASKRGFVVNAVDGRVDVVDLSNPAAPKALASIDTSTLGAANSVAVSAGMLAVAIEASPKQDPGVVAFYKASDSSLIGTVIVGSLPDMLTFTPDGRYVVVANEGEPNDDYTVDPQGSVSIIDVATRTARTASFVAFNGKEDELRAQGIRIFGPGAAAAQDFEPEYVAVSADSATAYVSLQENNAIAVIDIATATVTAVQPLGYKDHRLADNGFGSGNALDPSDRDSAISISNWPVFGMYQPDTIAAYDVGGSTYLVTANEGDARDYDGYSEESRVKSLPLDPVRFPDAATLQADAQLGRLNVTTALGDTDQDGDFDALYSFGGRSFSIRRADGSLVWDSGDFLEHHIAQIHPDSFNSDHAENDSRDSRSDNKGPEPEALALGRIGNKTFAFVGMERDSGLFVYDISNPTAPQFLQYLNLRDFAATDMALAGDLGPEGLVFIPAAESPNGEPLLLVANEVSGTLTLYRIQQTF